MLQDDSLPKTTDVKAKNGGPVSVTNCVFYGGEGTALLHSGKGVKIHNSMADILINDKEEWVQPAVVRMQATQEAGGGRQRPRGRGR